MLVGKESRFVEDLSQGLAFHHVFCDTQSRAQRLAEKFNEKLSVIPGVTNTTPRISFLDCMVYVVENNVDGRRGLLVEKMLDHNRYMKWNNNVGYVVGQEQPAVINNPLPGGLPSLFEIEGKFNNRHHSAT